MKYRITASCHFGLERTLKFEISKIGGEDIKVTDGKITFTGDANTVARANICLSTAERVMIEMGTFTAKTFDELFENVKSLPFENFIGKYNAFPVAKGSSLNSKLTSIPACQSIIKKAIVERLKTVYKVNWFDEDEAEVAIRFTILKDVVSIYLDTSGIALHKRGYRYHSNIAPISETLAAGIADIARVRADSVVCDPFCGSGTLLIESAFKAMNIAPGLNRSFSAEKWECFPKEIWDAERENARENINHEAKFKAYGWDIDPECIDLVNENAKKAGVSARIEAVERDIADFKRPCDGAIIMCNPPYGERMFDVKRARQLYKIMGKVFSSPAYIISPDSEFEKIYGKRADKKRKLYNGMLQCNLYQYFK